MKRRCRSAVVRRGRRQWSFARPPISLTRGGGLGGIPLAVHVCQRQGPSVPATGAVTMGLFVICHARHLQTAIASDAKHVHDAAWLCLRAMASSSVHGRSLMPPNPSRFCRRRRAGRTHSVSVARRREVVVDEAQGVRPLCDATAPGPWRSPRLGRASGVRPPPRGAGFPGNRRWRCIVLLSADGRWSAGRPRMVFSRETWVLWWRPPRSPHGFASAPRGSDHPSSPCVTSGLRRAAAVGDSCFT